MRTLLAWTGVAALSVLLGVILYSTSLQGSQAGYQETSPLLNSASASPTPAVKQPESGMAQELAEPAAPQVVVPPADQSVTVPAPVYAPSTSGSNASGGSNENSRERESENERENEREDD